MGLAGRRGAGADILIGGSGEDIASYRYSDAGVEVRLDDGTARGGDAEGNTFAGRKTIEYVQGGEKAQDSGVPAIEELIISLIFGESVEEAEEIEIPDIEDLFGSAHDDILVGTYSSNRLGGYRGNDELDGREGDDWLDGGPGNDQLWGGPDNDMLDGGEGDDTFFIAAGGGNDTILDFGNGEDKIDLTAFADIQSVEDRCRH